MIKKYGTIAAVVLSFLTPTASLAKKKIRSDVIKTWEEISTPKGFVLSNDLYYNRMCSKIWSKQIPAFQQKNPKVADPDIIAVGKDIMVQRCMELDPEAQAGMDDRVGPSTVKLIPTTSLTEKTEYVSPYLVYLSIYLGFITEEKVDDMAPVLGLAVSGDVFKHLGYNIRTNIAESIITLQSEARAKTSPGPVRYNFIFGLGNRFGLKNKDLNRVDKGADSFTYLGVGLELQPSDRHRVQLDVTTNLNESATVNAAASAMKRFGEDFWIGGYAEVQSTRSAIDKTKEDRRYITGGIKISF